MIRESFEVVKKHMSENMHQCNEDIELTFIELKQIKENIKQLEKREKILRARLELEVGQFDEFYDQDGCELATWKYSNPSKVFDSKAFKEKHPKIYEKFMTLRPGSRRLVFK